MQGQQVDDLPPEWQGIIGLQIFVELLGIAPTGICNMGDGGGASASPIVVTLSMPAAAQSACRRAKSSERRSFGKRAVTRITASATMVSDHPVKTQEDVEAEGIRPGMAAVARGRPRR
jgi:hypothetical protein